MDMEWMAWTPVVAGFFIFIFTLLVAMGIWQKVSPTVARRGFLPLVTTRGDRVFIGLLAGAYVIIAWIGLTELSLWIGLGISLCVLAFILWKG